VSVLSNNDPTENSGRWLCELAFLGINLGNLKIEELNNVDILRNLTENIKKFLSKEYKL
jgi:hypothetical protein